MTDLRDQVAEDRGVIKRIQLIFPGYHGYRINEDLRDADIILKDELYKRMLNCIGKLKEAEQALVRSGSFKALEYFGTLRSKIQMAAEDIKHHGAGYTGISPPVRVDAKKISSLYDLDMKIFENIKGIEGATDSLLKSCQSGNPDLTGFSVIVGMVDEISSLNNSRDALLYGGV
ncbi:MAG: hypothetical protein QXO03_00875 [Thermoplasmatales archaeon]